VMVGKTHRERSGHYRDERNNYSDQSAASAHKDTLPQPVIVLGQQVRYERRFAQPSN
jgi:hypothetical protein